jgi:MFS family permease
VRFLPGRILDVIAPPRLGRSFRWLLSAALINNVGDGVVIAAGPLLIASQTRDPFLVSLALMMEYLPVFLFGFIGGTFADRFDRKRMVILSNAGRALVLAVLVATIATGSVNIVVVLVALFAMGTAETFADSASSTLIPGLVAKSDLGIANSRMQGAFLLTNQLLTPPIGAFLFAVGMALPFATNAACYALGAVLISRVVTAPREPAGQGRSFVADLVEGFRTILAFNVTFGAAWSVLVLYATDRLGMSEVGFGLLDDRDRGRRRRRDRPVRPAGAAVLARRHHARRARHRDLHASDPRPDDVATAGPGDLRRLRCPRVHLGHDVHGRPAAGGPR